jgi:hypothetical protein
MPHPSGPNLNAFGLCDQETNGLRLRIILKTHCKEVRREDVDWTRVIHRRVSWQAFMNTVLKRRFPLKVQRFWTEGLLFAQEGIFFRVSELVS